MHFISVPDRLFMLCSVDYSSLFVYSNNNMVMFPEQSRSWLDNEMSTNVGCEPARDDCWRQILIHPKDRVAKERICCPFQAMVVAIPQTPAFILDLFTSLWALYFNTSWTEQQLDSAIQCSIYADWWIYLDKFHLVKPLSHFVKMFKQSNHSFHFNIRHALFTSRFLHDRCRDCFNKVPFFPILDILNTLQFTYFACKTSTLNNHCCHLSFNAFVPSCSAKNINTVWFNFDMV